MKAVRNNSRTDGSDLRSCVLQSKVEDSVSLKYLICEFVNRRERKEIDSVTLGYGKDRDIEWKRS